MRRLLLAALLLLPGCPEGADRPATDDDDDGPVAPAPFPDVCINEFMPSNGRGVVDEAGGYDDWIELHNPGEEAVSLDGLRLTDDLESPDGALLDGLEIAAGGFLLLWADGDVDAGAHHLDFALAQAGGSVALLDEHDRGSIVHYGAVASDVAVARAEDCCVEEGCIGPVDEGSPGRSNLLGAEDDVVRRGSSWTWTVVEPSGDWTALEFDDGGWQGGRGPLGYGDGHVVSFTETPPLATTWFRADFRLLQNDVFTSLRFELLRDAGAVVYLNGVEVVRSNLPDGPLDAGTWSTRDVDGREEAVYFPHEVDAALLVPGTNQLAVELHESGPGSNDRSFDLAVIGRR